MPILQVAQRRLWWLVLAGHHSPNGAPPTPTQPTTTMNTTTPFFAPVLPLQLNEDQIAQLDAICLDVTKQFFQKDYAEKIINPPASRFFFHLPVS